MDFSALIERLRERGLLVRYNIPEGTVASLAEEEPHGVAYTLKSEQHDDRAYLHIVAPSTIRETFIRDIIREECAAVGLYFVPGSFGEIVELRQHSIH